MKCLQFIKYNKFHGMFLFSNTDVPLTFCAKFFTLPLFALGIEITLVL